MRTLIQDIRYGVRTLLRKPGFTVAAIIALALGIGANTAIFSFVHGVLLRPLPYPDQDRIQLIFATSVQQNLSEMPLFLPDYLVIRNRVRPFETVAAYLLGPPFTLLTEQGAESFAGAIATAEFFDVLGVKPKIGRGFVQADEAPSAPSVVVISERLWRNQFNADPDIAGKIVNFTNGPHTVIGVMAAEVQYPRDGIDIWRNYRLPANLNRDGGGSWVIGRLRSDSSRRQAQDELGILATQLQQSSPLTNAGRGFVTKPLEEWMLGDLRTPLYVLLGAVVFVLLIATANVANLMLARSTARDKEVAIRTALGAGRLRIARQLLTESVVLSAAGGIVGLAIAQWVLDACVALAPAGIPRLGQVSVDSAVLGFTAVISLASGLLFGIFPAVQTKLVDLNSTLKEGGRGIAAGGSSSFRRALVVVEIALSLVLLTGAGITIRSFVRLRHVETGFDARNVLAVRMGLNPAKYVGEKTVVLYDEVQNRLARLPGVQATGITNSLPPIQNDANDSFTIEGRPAGAGDEAPIAAVLLVDPGYFKALSIPILHGRAFLDTDRANAPRVAMINETLANRHFPNADPLG